MTQRPEANKPAVDDEVVIHLDLKGISAVMRALEVALQTGRAELVAGSGVTLSYGSTSLGYVTVKTTRPDDDEDSVPDPPVPAELLPA